jgi:GNAT superfamily N-acetyltransferase
MEGGFWGYNLSFVDVHEAWRGHGIGSSLVKHLNHEPWLKGKTLCLTSYTELGQKHLAHVIDREITSTDFLVKQPWY